MSSPSLQASHGEVSRLQQEADAQVLARAAQEGGGAGRERPPQPREPDTRLNVPSELRSAGEVSGLHLEIMTD